jgi:hypothetical protein
MLIWAPELWPETAKSWYAKYEEQFWQQGKWSAGFREYPKDIDAGWFALNDVDAGPVIGGYGAAASAFGIGAARAMGRFDHAYALSAEAIVGTWPLPNGTLLGPRFLSNMSDAPYLGEAAMLFAFTRMPVNAEGLIEQVNAPGLVYTGILVYIFLGFLVVLATIFRARRIHQSSSKHYIPTANLQVSVWFILIITAVLVLTLLSVSFGLIILLTATLIPFRLKKQSSTERQLQQD